MLVDSHCHLDYLARDGDLDDVVVRARSAGIGAMVTISTKLSEFETVAAIATRYPGVWCSVGIHPHEAASETAVATDALVAMAGREHVVGIGETGLDYFYEHSPREAQQAQFRTHVAAARATGLPLIVHTRDADDDTVAILQEEQAKGPFKGLIHCFSSGRHLADKVIEMGMSISISGIVTFKRAEELRDVVRDVPLDRLLVETDAPYLAPVPKRGKRNEPALVTFTAAKVAEIKGIAPEALAEATTANFYRLFDRADPAITL